MKITINRRGGGKTTDAIKLANETGAYLVVRDRRAAELASPGCARFPITYEELARTGMRESFVRSVVIDDVEAFLAFLLPGLTIAGVTATGAGLQSAMDFYTLDEERPAGDAQRAARENNS